ncbi:redoxin family protein [bacterium]|nr:redoxin family protein [bacterium]MCB2179173.1 redoxin family protein [bacterium]
MRKMKILLGMVVLAAFVLGACSSAQPANDVMDNAMDNTMDNNMENETNISSDEMMDESNDMMEEDSADMDSGEHDTMDNSSDEMMDEDAGMMDEEMMGSLWYTHQFQDATTGQTFSVSDFKGKVVLVETMAMWCSNCKAQQNQIILLHEMLGERDDFVSVGLNIDPQEDLGMLSGYVEENGFDWYYGVASEEVIADISSSLGGQFLNPPSVPIVLVDQDGNLHTLPFGIKSAESLLEYLDPFLNS